MIVAEDMTIDQVAEEYGVSRSTVERAINDGVLRYHDGVNEERRVVTMIEAEDALHWWNTRHARRKRKPKRGQVRVIVGDLVDAADADDDEADGVAAADGGGRGLVTMSDAMQMTVAAYTRGAWVAGHHQAEQTLRPIIADLTTRLVEAERRAAAAEARAQERRGLWTWLRGRG